MSEEPKQQELPLDDPRGPITLEEVAKSTGVQLDELRQAIIDVESGKATPLNTESWHVGKLNIAPTGVTQSGCAAVVFDNVHHFNEFFASRPGLIILQATPVGCGGPLDIKWAVIYTKFMEQSDDDDIVNYGSALKAIVNIRKKREDAARARAEEAEYERKKTEKELQELGAKCKQHHGAVIEENTKLKKELKKAKAR